MKHEESRIGQQPNWDYCASKVSSKQNLVDIKANVKNSQFATPMFEFSGACSGCGETPYVKLISQLFGDHEVVANATGCSSIYSGSVPSTPYCENEKGNGPAWANSLFEDFCEFGLGMRIAYEKMRARLEETCNKIAASENAPEALKAAAAAWMEAREDADASRVKGDALLEEAKKGAEAGCDCCKKIVGLKHYLVKRSQWIIGGDGASYDIGYGGLDHVIASGKNVNILVLDTEVYSNTAWASLQRLLLSPPSPSLPLLNKRIRKKDLGLMATTYGYVYAAQVAMGADNAQTLKAIREAEAYDGRRSSSLTLPVSTMV